MDLKSCVLRSFGYELNEKELQELITWYEKIGQYKSQTVLHTEIMSFLVETFPNKTIHINEEDTSDITMLLSALDKAIKR